MVAQAGTVAVQGNLRRSVDGQCKVQPRLLLLQRRQLVSIRLNASLSLNPNVSSTTRPQRDRKAVAGEEQKQKQKQKQREGVSSHQLLYEFIVFLRVTGGRGKCSAAVAGTTQCAMRGSHIQGRRHRKPLGYGVTSVPDRRSQNYHPLIPHAFHTHPCSSPPNSHGLQRARGSLSGRKAQGCVRYS